MFVTLKDGTKLDVTNANESYHAGMNGAIVSFTVTGADNTVSELSALLTDDNVQTITLTTDDGKEYSFADLSLRSIDRYFEKDGDIVVVLTNFKGTE